MADVFISYKREDRRVAERLSIALEQLGFDVWWDFELLSGDRFRKVIEKVIDQCSATIVLWSHLSRESTFVVDEASYAREQNKLCPARIDDCRLPLGFGGDHVVDLSAWDGEMSHDGLQAVIRALEAKSGKKARLGARARDADEQKRFAELEAFKAAQIAENLSALRAFLREHPNGAFANFVRAQVEELAARAPVSVDAGAPSPPSAQVRQPERAIPPSPIAPPVPEPEGATSKGPPWSMIGVGGALAIALLALVVAFRPWEQQAQQTIPQSGEATRNVDAELEAAREDERRRVQAEFDERLRDQAVRNQQAAEATEAAPTQTTIATTPAAYDLALLHPDVRRVVEQARANAAQASSAASRARDSAAQAEDAARRGRSGESGYTAYDYANDSELRRRYEGAYSNNTHNGPGVLMFGAGPYVGDRYAGRWSEGTYRGAGVYDFAQNTNNAGNALRYEGEWAANTRHGMGIQYWRHGDRHMGLRRDSAANGPGVYHFADGRRYEGEWASDAYNGHGVLWDAQGRMINQGVWTNNSLTTPLSR